MNLEPIPVPHRLLLLDLEVDANERIRKIGAVLGNETYRSEGNAEALATLSQMAARADCVLGHNLARHDLAILAKHHTLKNLFDLPVIDTLYLSPLCFPENPYHHLVKDYKLASESVNDPVADGHLAFRLYVDEYRALAALNQNDPELIGVLCWLCGTSDAGSARLAEGMRLMFGALNVKCPSVDGLLQSARAIVARYACIHAAQQIVAPDVATETARWALAYALTWLRVAGHDSVLPPWVRHTFPGVTTFVSRFRDTPCNDDGCAYCSDLFNARKQLKTFFGYNEFRPLPTAEDGSSLQQRIVEAGFRNESLLAILPTGGGKSLCFQLPALARNRRRGSLTIVLSPLQALMKDQVDNLERKTGTPFTKALSGLLTPLERGEVLRGVRMGNVGILYVSPEQLRNRSFRNAISQREVGCWVFDEAHCLSKWGHDFRPDYLYAGRFIRELAAQQGVSVPPIACFTATAKSDVIVEILGYFKNETGQDLRLFEGGVERQNLQFEVRLVPAPAKTSTIAELLQERFVNGSGGVIVFRSTRDLAEQTAAFLTQKGMSAAYFHAGMPPATKKQVQDSFIRGDVRVICATTAFGMGIDKEDVRLVIHGDTPGSLENYLQEAGRAGRDLQPAECILLYDEQDAERQFRINSFSELSQKDIIAILRGLRHARADRDGQVVITTGELLRDEAVETEFDSEGRDADTKVRTAIAWLERAGFVERNENITNVFQATLNIQSLTEADEKIAKLQLSAREQRLWRATLQAFMTAAPDEGLSADQLMALPEFAEWLVENEQWRIKETTGGWKVKDGQTPQLTRKVIDILNSMAKAGLLKKSTLLSAFVRYKVVGHSRLLFEQVDRLEEAALQILPEESPDPEGWVLLSLNLLNQRLNDSGTESTITSLRQLLKSLEADGRGLAGSRGSIDLIHLGHDMYRVRLYRDWPTLIELSKKRRRLAGLILATILGKVPSETAPGKDVLVPFAMEDLEIAVQKDLLLNGEVKDPVAGIERALLYLHEQGVITLRSGLAVFRSAMTIQIQPRTESRYTKHDYAPLQLHYHERCFQVHVMSEYARRGLRYIDEARALVLAYFAMGRDKFIERYFPGQEEMLARATTAESYQHIVEDLGDPAQQQIVSAPVDRNMLILAGPGSGKTRAVVHRCAYLLRVERVRPRSILVVCFNHSAAMEVRRRLLALVGNDARGVLVQTYHALAMRLTGTSFAALCERRSDSRPDFDALIPAAVAYLRGENETTAGLEPDELRERLLAGFQHILVDEYQDIDQPQYDLVSAIAGRTEKDPDSKLSILAVGDDDQNIYGSFRKTSVEFIRRFEQDYQARIHHLVQNYRSTRAIIDVANAVISCNRERMKTSHPIRIDRRRASQAAGGPFATRDLETGGRVQCIEVQDALQQTAAALDEADRLHRLGVAWEKIAVLGRHHVDLDLIRALAERRGIPIRCSTDRDGSPPLHRVREVAGYLERLRNNRSSFAGGAMLSQWFRDTEQSCGQSVWTKLLGDLLRRWQDEIGGSEQPVGVLEEFLYEALSGLRRDYAFGEGLTLSTVHSAKGTEYDHVLVIGDWNLPREMSGIEEERRTLYVAMTRARHTLAVFRRRDRESSLLAPLQAHREIVIRTSTARCEDPAILGRRYELLGLDKIILSHPARFGRDSAIHQAIQKLRTGDRLKFKMEGQHVDLINNHGVAVSRLSSAGRTMWQPSIASVEMIEVYAMVNRYQDDEKDATYHSQCRVASWELPVCEITYRSTGDFSKGSPERHEPPPR